LARADSDNPLEDSLEMIRAHTGMSTEIFESRVLIGVILNVLTSAPDHLNLRIARFEVPWFAALAGSKAGAFSRFRQLKKDNLLASWSPRRTRWPAVDSGGTNPKEYSAVILGISFDNRLPIDFLVDSTQVRFGY